MATNFLRVAKGRIVKSLVHRGFFGTLGKLFAAPLDSLWQMRPSARRARYLLRANEEEFDRAYQVDTAGQIHIEGLSVDGPNAADGVFYLGSNPRVFHKILCGLSIHYEDYVFIDFGSGKGKALLLASEFPFRRIIGVEFASELHQIANRNIQTYHSPTQRCRDIVSHCMDAAFFEIPTGKAVLYFFNPFSERVLAAVLENVRRSMSAQPREIIVIYYWPYGHGPLDETPDFIRVEATPSYIVYSNCPKQPSVSPGHNTPQLREHEFH
jgi:hypothetical protein